MTADVSLVWPTEMTDELAAQSHALIGLVAGLGGAIGWMTPPSQAETDDWLGSVIALARSGDGALCTAWREDHLLAMGLWRRDEARYFQHLAELAKIMVCPRARGGRLGLTVTRALVADATRAGIETLHLGVRGNNHLAIQLYEEAGFVEWGRLPDVIEVGDERFDEVRMYLKLSRPAQLILRGSSPAGPGYSPPRRPPT